MSHLRTLVMGFGLSMLTAFVPFLSSTSWAKCASRYISFSPTKGTKGVPRNVQLFVSVYGWQRHKAEVILKQGMLVSGAHKVALAIKKTPASKHSFRKSYFEIRPQDLLLPGRTYRLVIPAKHKKPMSYFYDRMSSYTFKTGAKADTVAPSKPTKLSSKGYFYRRMGCGPSKSIPLSLVGSKDKATSVKQLRYLLDVTFSGAKKQKPKTFTVHTGPSYRAMYTSLGHGMCSGNYLAMRSGVYTIRVRTVDLAGNISLPSPAVSVKVP